MKKNIVFITDNNYIKPTIIAITSIYNNCNSNFVYNINILGNNLTTANIELLETEDEILKDYDDYETIENLMNDYDKALIDDRNITMTSEAVEYFDDNKDVFFVVGLAHIVGENGIANNLKQLGYNVEILNYK